MRRRRAEACGTLRPTCCRQQRHHHQQQRRARAVIRTMEPHMTRISALMQPTSDVDRNVSTTDLRTSPRRRAEPSNTDALRNGFQNTCEYQREWSTACESHRWQTTETTSLTHGARKGHRWRPERSMREVLRECTRKRLQRAYLKEQRQCRRHGLVGVHILVARHDGAGSTHDVHVYVAPLCTVATVRTATREISMTMDRPQRPRGTERMHSPPATRIMETEAGQGQGQGQVQRMD
jgi:hypothetical protein